jgi:hypothetical protein
MAWRACFRRNLQKPDKMKFLEYPQPEKAYEGVGTLWLRLLVWPPVDAAAAS